MGTFDNHDSNGKENATKQWVLVQQYNDSVRALYILEHFFVLLCQTTTLNDQIESLTVNVDTRMQILKLPGSSTIWANREVNSQANGCLFSKKWRFL